MDQAKPIALVTGGNRGLGLETVRQLAQHEYKVVLTCRDSSKGKKIVADLLDQGLDVLFHALDVTNPSEVENLRTFLTTKFGRIDVLINNAGVFLESEESGSASVLTADIDLVRQVFEINTLGALRVSQALIPLMQGQGRVVNVSSGMGQLSDMNSGFPGYRFSKVSLNALTRILADELKDSGIKINSLCPGWVRTDMGGANATRTVEHGVETIVWLATLPDDGPSGGFFRDKQPIPW